MAMPASLDSSSPHRNNSSNSSDCDSFSDGTDFSQRSFHEDDVRKKEVQQVEHLSRWETRGIQFWRTVVVLLLAVAGVLVATGTYIFLRNAEAADYRNRYFLFTHTIGDASQFHITNMHQAVRSLSQTITASAWANNSSFPFVTTPVFEVAGDQARHQSGIEAISYTPLVNVADVAAWNNYSLANQGWIDQSRAVVSLLSSGNSAISTPAIEVSEVADAITPFIYELDQDGLVIPSAGRGPFAPIWTSSPPPFHKGQVNYNTMVRYNIKTLYPVVALTGEGVFTDVHDIQDVASLGTDPEIHADFHKQFGGSNISAEAAWSRPHSILLQPVYGELSNGKSNVVGLLHNIVPWDRYLTNLLPDGVIGIVSILSNTCGQKFSYVINGNQATYLGEGDLHEAEFDDTVVSIPLYSYTDPNRTANIRGHCEYSLLVYASSQYKVASESSTPVIFAAVVAVVFFLVIVTFILYDLLVQRRNDKVVGAAARSNAMLSSLFPSTVRDRLIASHDEVVKKPGKAVGGAKTRLRNFLDDDGGGGEQDLGYEGKPIADLFPETTILFADIAGFTAWSSVREPAQVFTLLETLYRAFDEIAKRRRVFKVETVGDCYVAVTGLPDPRKDHAVAMARFARDCIHRVRLLTKKLEVSLGPDTGDLSMRAGLHSGPVTAGVLRGERSRFQLFGDTMNTASRMESTGKPGRIQISQDTADLLVAAGKSEWFTPREEKVVAKGKGEMQTYWLGIGESNASTSMSGSQHGSDGTGYDSTEQDNIHKTVKVHHFTNSKTKRLIDWNVDVLARLLRQIVARRKACGLPEFGSPGIEQDFDFAEDGKTVIDEVKEIIELPKFNAKIATQQVDPESITLPDCVMDQLTMFVSNIAALYNDNPFHNFEHASHVTMSVVKLLSRIVAPSEIEYDENLAKTGKNLHDHTYGITSDPLTQFACVFSALIHDADHSGVPNVQLVKEKAFIAQFYKGQSIAEQNSVDLAWQMLMDDSFSELRSAIYTTASEFLRFRQLVVNSVMATDIVDKELKALRNDRWAKAFSESAADCPDSGRRSTDDVNRKATIVIEHLIQASDIAHTMQHWHIYRKWNERFFTECYQAYIDGRAETDPSEGWYQGEMGFYDFYIIPLAKKLKDCGVFGVSSDEYLNYAVRNRKEWEERGREVVDEMVETVKKQGIQQHVKEPEEQQALVLEEPKPSQNDAKETMEEERIEYLIDI